MRKSVFAVTVWSLLLLTTTGSPAAGAGDSASSINPVGRPTKVGKSFRLLVYYEAGAWHIRAEGGEGKHEHNTKGSVSVEGGTIIGGGAVGTEDAQHPSTGKTKRQIRAENKKEKKDDDFGVHSDKRGFAFDWHTSTANDGVDFTLSKGAQTVTFRIQIDGDDATKSIFIGGDSMHPDAAKFTLVADPERTK